MTTDARPHVLIVDDDANVIAALLPLLSGACQLRAARNGADALRLAAAQPPDLVLLDVEMPDIGGYEVCRLLKDDPTLAEVPVIFLSHHGDVDAEVRGLAAGAVDFIVKPPRGPSVLARIQTHVRLKQLNAELRRAALVDSLTGVANRRHWNEVLAREQARALRSRFPLALLMIDIDHFKAYNDRHGHVEGDACLHDVAQALQRCLGRSGDLLARYGGEEFAMLLPATNRHGARTMAERVLAGVAALRRAHGASSAGPCVSVSVGYSVCDACTPGWPRRADQPPGEETQARSLVAGLALAADAALYEAKRGGRARARCVDVESPAAKAAPCVPAAPHA